MDIEERLKRIEDKQDKILDKLDTIARYLARNLTFEPLNCVGSVVDTKDSYYPQYPQGG